jgi:DNA-binding CsgD family transcriptional regulator
MSFDHDRWLAESYESIFDADAFYRQFETLAAAYDSITCALHVEQSRAKQLSFVVGADPGSVAKDYPNFRNLWLERGAQKLLTSGVTHDGMHTSVREMERTDYHRHLLRPLGIDHSIGVLCDRFQDGGFTMLSLSRSRISGPYEDLEAKRLNQMRPHFRTLFRLHARALRQDHRIANLEAMVARSVMPRLQLDAQLRVRVANPAAEAFLQESDLICLGPDDVLSIGDRRAAEQFVALLQAGGAFELILFSRATGRRAVLQLEPLHLPRRPGYVVEAGYLVTLALIPRDLVAPAERLASLFGLTQRETDVARTLASTFDLRDAAEHLDIRHETARSHLKRCFEKTMTSSQVELVTLVRDVLGLVTGVPQGGDV